LARVLDEDTTHGRRRDLEKVPVVVPSAARIIGEAQISLVHERGGAESVAARFATKLPTRKSPQLIIDDGKRAIEGLTIASAGLLDQIARHAAPSRFEVHVVRRSSGRE